MVMADPYIPIRGLAFHSHFTITLYNEHREATFECEHMHF